MDSGFALSARPGMTNWEQAMPVYTVHAPPVDLASGSAPEDYVFILDGFYVWAMEFGLFWMLFRRLWLVSFLYVLLIAALAAVM